MGNIDTTVVPALESLFYSSDPNLTLSIPYEQSTYKGVVSISDIEKLMRVDPEHFAKNTNPATPYAWVGEFHVAGSNKDSTVAALRTHFKDYVIVRDESEAKERPLPQTPANGAPYQSAADNYGLNENVVAFKPIIKQIKANELGAAIKELIELARTAYEPNVQEMQFDQIWVALTNIRQQHQKVFDGAYEDWGKLERLLMVQYANSIFMRNNARLENARHALCKTPDELMAAIEGLADDVERGDVLGSSSKLPNVITSIKALVATPLGWLALNGQVLKSAKDVFLTNERDNSDIGPARTLPELVEKLDELLVNAATYKRDFEQVPAIRAAFEELNKSSSGQRAAGGQKALMVKLLPLRALDALS